jgi:hypothetical protein
MIWVTVVCVVAVLVSTGVDIATTRALRKENRDLKWRLRVIERALLP